MEPSLAVLCIRLTPYFCCRYLLHLCPSPFTTGDISSSVSKLSQHFVVMLGSCTVFSIYCHWVPFCCYRVESDFILACCLYLLPEEMTTPASGNTTSTSKQTVCCSEMAPPHLRGRFNQLYQIVLTFFILVAQVINLIINLTDAVSWGWRLSLGFAFVPSLILFLGGVFLPDSPNSLLERGHLEQVGPATQTWHVLRTFVASVFNQSTH